MYEMCLQGAGRVARPYEAVAIVCVGADDSVRPAERTDFLVVFGESEQETHSKL